MYRIFRSTGPRSSVEISGPYNTFGLAKKALWEIYNKLMWQGTILSLIHI